MRPIWAKLTKPYVKRQKQATIKNINNNKCWQGYGGKRNPHTLLRECKLVQPLWKTEWSLLKKLEIDLLYDPAILLLGIYSKEHESGYYRGTSTPMCIAALLTIAKLWKQSRGSTTEEWIKKM
jgi:hypothetical protein